MISCRRVVGSFIVLEGGVDMAELSTKETWRAVLGELELQLPRPTFETWLKQTEGISSNDTSFVVEV